MFVNAQELQSQYRIHFWARGEKSLNRSWLNLFSVLLHLHRAPSTASIVIDTDCDGSHLRWTQKAPVSSVSAGCNCHPSKLLLTLYISLMAPLYLLTPLSSLSLIPPKLCIHTRRRSVEQGGLLIGTSLIIWSYSVPAVICFDLWSQHCFETTDYFYLVAVIKVTLLSTASAWLESSHSSGDRCVSNVYQNACWYASRVSNPQIRI